MVNNPCYFFGEQSVSFFLDNRTTSGGISLFVNDSTTNILIENCHFVNNSARNDSIVALMRRSSGYGHGGAANLRLLNSSDGGICIKNSKFVSNSAEAHAGALAIAMAGSSAQNRVVVMGTVFEENSCLIADCTGGAVGISFLTETHLNTILFLGSNFTNNSAISGGAIVLSTSVGAEVIEEDDRLVLKNCLFVNNSAFFEGTALGVFSVTHTHQIGLPVDIFDW